ncbi:MAG: outer membrane protein assembly factor BamC, partial [Rhodoferax sp.]|nr:outer membrane protein assembly factor BamC [Rhodoferax sp.]
MRISRCTHLLAVVGLTVGLGACSALDSDKVDYRSATKGPALDVPPDLTQLSRENRYVVPGSVVTASGFKAAQPAASNLPTAAASLGDVRIERNGNQRWLAVQRSPESLWQPLRDFWKEGGFVLTLDQPPLGIMETDWAENRAKIPQDFIRSTLGKLFDNLYSTGERDRFRIRLERNAGGETEIYISHRGMVEVYG